jgi:protein-disulfide isomerase/uncharacterized membrane protein YphA (DoxX/SURF4 family)
MRSEAQSSFVNWNPIRPWLGTVIRLVLGVVWIWAAWSKLHSPRAFVQAVRAYDATPEWLSKAIGYGLPVIEVSLGILLVVGVAVRLAAAVSAVLFVVFLIGLIQAAARNIQIDCGCFGNGGATTSTSYTLDILRDVGLLLLAAYLVVWSYTRVSIEEFLGRNDYVEAPSAKRLRTEKGARKYNAMLEARRKEARSRALYLNGSLAVVVVLVGLIGIGVQSGRAKIQGSLSAPHASVADGVVFGKKAAATVDVYEDFQCPHCLDFEKAVSKTMEADVRANRAQVRYHPLAFLDSASNGNQYSSRAANAALCASDVSIDTFVKFHDTLFGVVKGKQVQPTEGSSGRPNSDFVSYAQLAGITGAKLTTFTQCVQTEQYKALVQGITDYASQHGVNATPTIKINGKTTNPDLASYQTAVAAALKTGPAPNPSKTPSPTPTTKAPTTSVPATPTTSAKKSP